MTVATQQLRSPTSPYVPSTVKQLSAARAYAIPFAFTLALAAMAALPYVRGNPRLLASFLGASAVLLAWTAISFASARRKGRELTVEVVLRKQHYLQACMQGTLLLTWGYFWRPVYDAAPLIVAQLLFAYAFDILLAWSRRDTYTLGFGPFPVIFSINLFLWFKKDWFYLQFLLVAVGFAAKELIRWTKDGRRVHIFNPSSFPLAIFSLALFLLNKDGITFGPEIADTQNWPPYIYLVMFVVGLTGQYLFGVTTMTMSAMITTVGFSQLYYLATGSYFFLDAHVPIAVFLGMTLLFTDPSTSPRTELGRILFGIAYGLSAVLLFWLLQSGGKPTFYDKLLQVPILNLSILLIDRLARSKPLSPIDPARLGQGRPPRRRNLVYMTIWGLAFAGMYATGMVGDRHPGQYVSFWRDACERDARKACQVLGFLEHYHCGEGSGWACNEEGIRASEQGRPREVVGGAFQRACQLGFAPACANRDALAAGSGSFRHAPPELADYPILIRGRKAPIAERDPQTLYRMACERGFEEACGDASSAALRLPEGP